MGEVQLRKLNVRFRDGYIIVRASRVWEFRGGTDQGDLCRIDMVLIDSQGFPMYAEIPSDAFHAQLGKVHEGKIYKMERFTVAVAKKNFMPVHTPFMINISLYSRIIEHVDQSLAIPLYTYRPTKFSEVGGLIGETKHFVDIVGLITEVTEAENYYIQSQGRTTLRRRITLTDISNYELQVYMWGNKAIEFDENYVREFGQERPLVAIFVGLLVKPFQDGFSLSANAPARCYINIDVPEVLDFLDRIEEDFIPVEITPVENVALPIPEPLPDPERKNLQEIKETSPYDFPPEGFKVTVTITRVNQNTGWFFASCNKCSKACRMEGNTYKCGSCDCSSFKFKYKICLFGTDGTAEAEFIFFGNMGRCLLNRDIVSLMKTTPRAGDIPVQIAALVSQKFQLTINVTARAFQRAGYSYQVKSINRSYGRQATIPEISTLPGDGRSGPQVIDNKKGKRKIGESSGISSTIPSMTVESQQENVSQTEGKSIISTEGGTSQKTPPNAEFVPSMVKDAARTTTSEDDAANKVRRALYRESSPTTEGHTESVGIDKDQHTLPRSSPGAEFQSDNQQTKKAASSKKSKKG